MNRNVNFLMLVCAYKSVLCVRDLSFVHVRVYLICVSSMIMYMYETSAYYARVNSLSCIQPTLAFSAAANSIKVSYLLLA